MSDAQTQPPSTAASGTFTLSSPAFEDGGAIPDRHGCRGEDVSPQLDWNGAPAGTAELVLILDDPDARGFLHWLLTGIPGSPQGTLPEGRGDASADPAGQGRNDFGRTGYGGPCPPARHTYVFSLSALSGSLDVADPPDLEAVRAAMDGKVLAEARLTGTYERRA